MMTLRIFPCRLQSLIRSRSFQSSRRHLHDIADGMIVNVVQGALRGRRVTSKSGGSYISFQGIPYARPPVGHLRFKAPEPALSWTGVRDALREGNVCCQVDPMLKEFIGDEDCLFLNVYTPVLPNSDIVEDVSKAVMVYIHGGGFATGSGDSAIYGPDHLVDQGIIVVTCNYRLGPLGFLTTEDGEIPGNAGLKDQVAALRWVQQNIARFGGNPGNVTIFGESAGGASVHYHLLSPMSKGLFQRAISQSGSALNSWAYSNAGHLRTVRLARALGCKSEDSKDVLDFLRGIPAQRLVDNQILSMTNEEKRRAGELMLPFVPTSEQMVSSDEEIFLPAEPLDIIQSGNFNMVPYITGFNTNEGLLILKDITGKADVLKKIDTDFQRLLPEDMFPQIDTTKSLKAAQTMKKFFFGNKTLCQETLQEYADLKSDTLFVYKIYKTIQMQARLSSSPVYSYLFGFDGQLGLYKQFVLNEDMPGVAHADELGYLFHISMVPLEFDAKSPEMRVLGMMVKMWTNFAKTGNPSSGVSWKPVSPDRTCFLKIDEVPAMVEDVEAERIRFWNDLYRDNTSAHAQRKTYKKSTLSSNL